MTRLAFHRPARILPPRLPDQKVTLPAPPQIPQSNPSSTWVTLVLPMLSSVGMAAYMISYRQRLMVVLGITFVVISVGATIGIRWQMRSSARKTRTKQRDRYLDIARCCVV